MSHLDDLDEYEAELELRIKKEYAAVFGLFQGREQVHRALPLFNEALFREALFKTFREERVFPITLVSRAKYRSEWCKRLRSHTREIQWPPQSRYAG